MYKRMQKVSAEKKSRPWNNGNNMRKMIQKLENDRTKENENLTTFSSHLFFLMQTL